MTSVSTDNFKAGGPAGMIAVINMGNGPRSIILAIPAKAYNNGIEMADQIGSVMKSTKNVGTQCNSPPPLPFPIGTGSPSI